MSNVTFLNPGFFWLFLLIPVIIAWQIGKRNQQTAHLKISSIEGFKHSKSILAKLKPALFVLRVLALSALIVAMARPRTVDVSSKTKTTKGIDIVMAIDVSGSMLAKDLKPNRMEGLKVVAEKFAEERPNDRIGLVVYASEAYTKTPVTSDKAIILDAIRSIKYDNVLQDGTGIGMGLTTAMNRLKDSGIEFIIYEPNLYLDYYSAYQVIKNLDEFKQKSDLIVTNRMHPELNSVIDKVFTRDLFGEN